MTVVRLDEDDLDDEDRAILAEVSKKGYYHGRPKNQAGPPPAKIEATAPQKLEAVSSSTSSRAAFDDFQRKWDRFDDDSYLKKLERETLKTSSSSSSSAVKPEQPLKLPVVAEFKVLLVGDAGVGKSALIKSHLTGEFERKWIRISDEEVHQLRFHTNCGDVAVNVWIAAGGSPCGQRERFYTQGHAAIAMFDVTSRASFRSIPNWQREIKKVLGTIPTVVLGNKVDFASRQVTPKQIHSYTRMDKRRGDALQYYDISVRDKHNFERPFLWLLRMLTSQRELQFVGPVAKAPQQLLAAQLYCSEKHKRQLQEALHVTVESETPL